MMVKYRVHEVAKDLGTTSKDIINLVKEYTGVEKKHMTALSEEELNIIFEYYTQRNQVENFDEYFSQMDLKPKKPAKSEPEQAAAPAESLDAPQIAKKESKKSIKKEFPKEENTGSNTEYVTVTSRGKEKITAEKVEPINQEQKQKPFRKTDVGKEHSSVPIHKRIADAIKLKGRNFKSQALNLKEQTLSKHNESNQHIKRETHTNIKPKDTQQNPPRVQKPAGRIVDTRSAHVDIEKYNEKYDRLASEKMRIDNTIHKQKITQRSQKRVNLRNSRKETEAERLKRIALERKNKPITISVPEEITVGDLALKLKATASEVIKKLMVLGTMASINDVIDFDTASLVAMEFHAKVEKEVVVTIEEMIIDDSEDADENLSPRAPVVVVMGHVDHGKTSLLDAIRQENVTSTEAGGITQHIGAYRVSLNGKEITFLDTPGHEAFTTMRARGAQVTDIAILVVAADDGIMPQTIEAINHAKAAEVSIIVAINKIDKPGANPDNIKQQLTEHGLVPEEWGGDVPCILVSAKKKEGIDDLLEMINLVAEMKELKANKERAARGTVIEAKLDKGKGPVATVLVQNGTLHTGDIVVAGTAVGKVRAMTNDVGRRVKAAGPSVPVEITGLDSVPLGGDKFNCVSDERLARELVEQRRDKIKEELFNSQTKVTLDNLFDQMQQGDVKELRIIVKADVQGSVEAVKQSLEKISNSEVRVRVIHGAVGAINESDVMLANASNAIIVGFNVRPEVQAEENAKISGVDIRLYRVIYNCIDEITAAMKGMLAPKVREVQLGRAECRQIYKISNVGTIAGCYVVDGKISRNANIRVVREGIVIVEDEIASLKRFKDDVKEVLQGYECGIGLQKFNDIKNGDVFEAFVLEEYNEE
ncbi:MAG: translation initiation factor IF-2 [Clostridia bacterium]|nr:translation initiation factor IF-2 [Clostridia bacterium]